jgi:hypothetical protein
MLNFFFLNFLKEIKVLSFLTLTVKTSRVSGKSIIELKTKCILYKNWNDPLFKSELPSALSRILGRECLSLQKNPISAAAI